VHSIADGGSLPAWVRALLLVAVTTALIAAVLIFIRPWIRAFTQEPKEG
jgi:hypothetical protein